MLARKQVCAFLRAGCSNGFSQSSPKVIRLGFSSHRVFPKRLNATTYGITSVRTFSTNRTTDFDHPTPNFDEELDKLRTEAKSGNADAQCSLGELYYEGTGVIADKHRAIELFKESATQNNARAQLNLGLCYQKGDVVPQNYDEAVKLLSLSAQQDNRFALHALALTYLEGRGVKKAPNEAMKYFERAIQLGDDESMALVGTMHLHGDEHVTKDVPKAIELLQKAASSGNTFAQYKLGRTYLHGTGISQNVEKALELLAPLAEQGHASAQSCLGYYYYGFNNGSHLRAALQCGRLPNKVIQVDMLVLRFVMKVELVGLKQIFNKRSSTSKKQLTKMLLKLSFIWVSAITEVKA